MVAETPRSKGGQVPLEPYDSTPRASVRKPPTKEDLFKILERVTPDSYHQPIIDDPRGSVATYRQMTKQTEAMAIGAYRSQQASFFLPYPVQGDIPASSLTPAMFNVDVTRTKDLDVGRILEPGTLDMTGPQGRRYTNAERVEWIEFDPATKTIACVAEQAGYVGNLEFLEDPDTGLLTDPKTGDPALDVIDLKPQAVDATNVDATILTTPGALAKVKDNGLPFQFSADHVGLYIFFINAPGTGATGKSVRIIDFESSDVEDPGGSGLFPNFITIDDGPQRHQIRSTQADDGGVFTDETIAARNDTADDMTLLPATAAAGDAYYFGHTEAFEFIELTISTGGAGDWVVVWEYFDGASFVALSDVVDNTDAFKFSGTNRVSYTVPLDWASTTINSIAAFYIRARVTSVTTTTTQPLGQQCFIFQALDFTNGTPGAVDWRIDDWIDLGFTISQMEAPSGGTDNILRLLGEERGVFQQTNETDTQFRERAARLADAVSPNAINRALNRELEVVGLPGLAIDVGNGFDGFFCDIDFLDYYEPGDPDGRPPSPYKLLLSNKEAYGWFFVFVPCIDDGTDFGFAWDDGPETVIGTTQIAGAWGFGFYDGFVTTADSIYRSIYNAIDSLRAGGIGFVMIKDCTLNTPCVPPGPS